MWEESWQGRWRGWFEACIEGYLVERLCELRQAGVHLLLGLGELCRAIRELGKLHIHVDMPPRVIYVDYPSIGGILSRCRKDAVPVASKERCRDWMRCLILLMQVSVSWTAV